jgi:type I restriction enzyme S subunit
MQLIEPYFDTALESPDGVKKLRELILVLGMQGKLVPQDISDPPASELLKDVRAEKKRLVQEGKIKDPKPLPAVTTDEVSYTLPTGWAWVRFGEIAKHNSGKTLDSGRNSGVARDYITTSNLYWGRFELSSLRRMLMRDEELERCTARKGDLLICEGGEAGRAAVWELDREVCFQNHVHRARFYKNISPYFAYRYFEKLNATRELEQHRKGVGISNMSSKALASIMFPLPPLREQSRIVAKIDELMSRCDELERLRSQRDTRRLAVHAAAIRKLLHVADTDGHVQARNFLSEHFGELYTVKENVTELRKAILQLAIMGRLIPPDSGDPSAREWSARLEMCQWIRETLDKESIWDEARSTNLSRW